MEISEILIKAGIVFVALIGVWILVKGLKLAFKLLFMLILFGVLMWLFPELHEFLTGLLPQ